jgi:hypothetical protein
MDISEIRHRNILALVDAMKARGINLQKDQALSLNMAPSFLSQLVGGKKMGDDVARKIESATRNAHGWMDRPQWDDPATGSNKDSQPVILDPLMISETHKSLRKLKQELGLPVSLEDPEDAARFVQLYQLRAALPAQPSTEELIQHGRKIASIMTARGAEKDGRDDGVPANGTRTANVARRVRHKG